MARSILTSKASPTSFSNLDNDNETAVEVEEAFLQTTNLPFNLQLKGGQFLPPFGRINPTHPHTWDFADDPLVHGRLLGPDGLRGVGAQVSWTIPVPWYSQLIVASQNGRGGTGFSFRNPGDNGMFFGSPNDRSRSARFAGFRLDPALGKFRRSQSDAGCARRAFPAHSVRTKPAPIRARRFTAPIFSTNGRARTRKAVFPL